MTPLRLLCVCLSLLALLSITGSSEKPPSEDKTVLYDGKSTYSRVSLAESPQLSKFSVSLWIKTKRKVLFGHLPQCIFAKGNWFQTQSRETVMSLFLTPTSKLVLTLTLARKHELKCEIEEQSLHPSRWYHIAFNYDEAGTLDFYINGVSAQASCHFPDSNKINLFTGNNFLTKRIGTIPTGPLLNKNDEEFSFTIGSCGHREEGLNPDDFLFYGQISDFLFYSFLLTPEQVRDITRNWVPTLTDAEGKLPVPVVVQFPMKESISEDMSRIVYYDPPDAKTTNRLQWEIFGDARTLSVSTGDRPLSVMLTVAVIKLAYNEKDAAEKLGSLISITERSKMVNEAMRSSLQRLFQVGEEEEQMFSSLNQYSRRLELTGHSISLLLKGIGKKSDGEFKMNIHEAEKKTRPVIALIVPATSVGTPTDSLIDLPLVRALLPSIYSTMSSVFDYRVYLVVNENDKVYSDNRVVDLIFKVAKEAFGQANSNRMVEHRVVKVPDTMTPKYALSALFNIGTLTAFHDNCEYFYLVNDDLLLITRGWSEVFTSALMNNPLYPGLGVAGGADVSDAVTPQIEFPFFHRTHIFHWCGANPWTFSNWWEDNWLTDIYTTFDSLFYDTKVLLSNYVGIDRKATAVETSKDESNAAKGALDPRYEVVEGRKTPHFYQTEVEKARDLIKSWLSRQFDMKDDVVGELSLKSVNTSYCHFTNGKLPTLSEMSLAQHEEPLDPCNTYVKTVDGDIRPFKRSVHEQEMPHQSYAELIHGEVLTRSRDQTLPSSALFFTSQCDEKSFLQNWKQCSSSIGLNELELRANKAATIIPPMSHGQLCSVQKAVAPLVVVGDQDGLGVKKRYGSCSLPRGLKILILHNHCPLFTRYGSDKRLYHVAESLRALGHTVNFGGMDVSGLETADDHLRLKALGASLYSPLTTRDAQGTMQLNNNRLKEILVELVPDIAIMTMWFWNVPPATEVFMDALSSLMPSLKQIVLSDDAHTMREEAMEKERLKSTALRRSDMLISKIKIANVFQREYSAYARAHAIMTITDKDRQSILDHQERHNDFEEFIEFQREEMRIDEEKIQTVRYAISDTEISLAVPPFSSRGDCLVFVGNGANPTNVASITYFLEELFHPIRREYHPDDVQLHIIGADWEDFMSSYPMFSTDIKLHGLLPQEELTVILETCKVFVSPITNVSTGLNTKNVLALSRGIPLVTTPSGADGLLLVKGSPTSPPALVANTASDFVFLTLGLLRDSSLWQRVSTAALVHANAYFSLTAQAHDLEKIINIAYKFTAEMGSE